MQIEIVYKNKDKLYSYTTNNCKYLADAEILWKVYVREKFTTPCKIVEIRRK